MKKHSKNAIYLCIFVYFVYFVCLRNLTSTQIINLDISTFSLNRNRKLKETRLCKILTAKFQNHPINIRVEADRDAVALNYMVLISRSAFAPRNSSCRCFFPAFLDGYPSRDERDDENHESPIIKSFFRHGSACLQDKRQKT